MKRTLYGPGRGRPPLDADDDSVPVHVKMPSAQYDDAYRRAQLARVSVPEQIRRDMRKAAGNQRRRAQHDGDHDDGRDD